MKTLLYKEKKRYLVFLLGMDFWISSYIIVSVPYEYGCSSLFSKFRCISTKVLCVSLHPPWRPSTDVRKIEPRPPRIGRIAISPTRFDREAISRSFADLRNSNIGTLFCESAWISCVPRAHFCRYTRIFVPETRRLWYGRCIV